MEKEPEHLTNLHLTLAVYLTYPSYPRVADRPKA